MTDYFALLDQPRGPWLDPVELKNVYHQKTLQSHPDATLNEAYQVLQDPKRRLHHLLSLEGFASSSASQTIPKQLQDLFPSIGALTQRAQLLLEKISATSNALSRSLLKPQIVETGNEIRKMRETLQRLYDDAANEAEAINARWSLDWPAQIDSVSNLYYSFAYLGRWIAQLEEIQFQLSLH